MTHTLITLLVVLSASVFGYGVEALLLLSGIWFGREHAQAEYRYMRSKRTNRLNMPWYAGFLYDSWTYKALFKDFIFPILITLGVLICITFFL